MWRHFKTRGTRTGPPLLIVLSPNVRNNNPSKPDIRKNFITKSSRVLNTNFSQQIQIPTKYIELDQMFNL